MEIKMDDFYSQIARRPRLDLVIDKEEKEFWDKTFAGSNDITVYSWMRNGWFEQMRDNLKHFGYFHRDHSAKIYANELIGQPVILVGAGPSLELNIEALKLAKEKNIKIMASAHSLMYLADYDIKPDWVCMLDAGKMWTDYLAFGNLDMKDVPLLADQVCDPDVLKSWPGPVKFFKSQIPDTRLGEFAQMEFNRLVPIRENSSVIEVGGHVMGSMLSIIRGIMQASTICFVGADYCASYKPDGPGKFYPFDKKIDQTVNTANPDGTFSEKPAAPGYDGQCLDIFGITVATNKSYLGFKNVMDQSIKVTTMQAWTQNPAEDFECINATEGGVLGALNRGVMKWMSYMRLQDAVFYMEAKKLAKGM